MACLILKTLILKSMRLVGALVGMMGQRIGAWIVQGALEENLELIMQIKKAPVDETGVVLT